MNMVTTVVPPGPEAQSTSRLFGAVNFFGLEGEKYLRRFRLPNIFGPQSGVRGMGFRRVTITQVSFTPPPPLRVSRA